ncbi:MAG: hypothetical protein QM537_03755 [Candidatus Symbiobacter sp.]|nr:hypothetical protein [Candidatus Symbiobacter sp.]
MTSRELSVLLNMNEQYVFRYLLIMYEEKMVERMSHNLLRWRLSERMGSLARGKSNDTE